VTADFSVVLLSDAAMRKHNARYAAKRGSTDVLSFPTDEAFREISADLGDILISVETANRRKTKGLGCELKVLALHGLLHLLGYDHESDSGEMGQLEEELRREFGLG
jgi:probable rRNA maturation factor